MGAGLLGLLGRRAGAVATITVGLAAMGCAGRGGEAKQPLGHFEKKTIESPDDAPDEAKTVQVSYIFDRDVVNKDFQKSIKDGFEKKGVKVDEQLDAKAHFAVSGAKITGTVTYVKKGMGRYSILDADLVAEAHYDADVQMDLDVKVKGDTKKVTEKDLDSTALGGKPYPIVTNVMPTNIPIAGPLFLHAHFDLNAACDLNIQGQMHATAGVGIKGDVHLAAKYKKAGFVTVDQNDETAQKKSKFKFEANTPNFELSPRPYLKVEGKQQQIKGSCGLQPTVVLLLEKTVGASLVVEPWLELEAKRANTKAPWQLGAEIGVTVSAVPEVRIFGRKIGKRREFELMEKTLAKMNGKELAPGRTDPMPAPETPVTPSPSRNEIPRNEVASATPAPAAPPAPPSAQPASSQPAPQTAEPSTTPSAVVAKNDAPPSNTPAPPVEQPIAAASPTPSPTPSTSPSASTKTSEPMTPDPVPPFTPSSGNIFAAALPSPKAPSTKAIVRRGASSNVLSGAAAKLVKKKR